MKKIICLFTAFVCLCAFTVPCLAATDVIFTLKAEQQHNKNVIANIYISKDSSLYTTEFNITFDPNELEFIEKSIAAGDAIKELDPYISANQVAPGQVKISYTCTEPIDKSGELCRIELRAKTNTQAKIDIEIDHAETFDGDHIRSLSAQAEGTVINITKQANFPFAAVIIGIVAVAAVAAVIVTIKKRKHKK